MEEAVPHVEDEAITISLSMVNCRDAPKLLSLLKEMKSGLDLVTAKVQSLTQKVKENCYPTSDGISYLDAKHMLLLGYCQCIVYYLLRKAKGLPVGGHPVVRSLVEIRMFLEKIRPIDRKFEYQFRKLTRAADDVASDNVRGQEGRKDGLQDAEDPLRFRPNPDMLVSKQNQGTDENDGLYHIPRFAPTKMDEEDKVSKKEKQALRKEKQVLQQAKRSAYLKELLDEVEGRPEEIRETFGPETRELQKYKAKLEERARQEEELFIRVPVTKREKKLEKRLLRDKSGLQGLTDDLFDEIRTLPVDQTDKDDAPDYFSSMAQKKSKRKH